MNALVLLSGGIDSAACVAFYRSLDHPVKALFVDYGKATSEREARSAKEIADYYVLALDSVVCRGPKLSEKGEILGRNGFLLLAALLYHPEWTGVIALGIHAGTTYCDCQPRFVTGMSEILDAYSNGRVVIGTPFIDWSKNMIGDYCLKENVPLPLTWSCEIDSVNACGKCRSCRDVEALYARAPR